MTTSKLLACLALGGGMCFAGTDEVIIRESPPEQVTFDLAKYGQYMDPQQAQILSVGDAVALLRAASSIPDVVKENPANPVYGTKATFSKTEASDFYCLIHVLTWEDISKDSNDMKTVKPDKQNWYVYHAGKSWRQEDFRDNKRLFGSKNVWLLFVHLNIAPTYSYTVRYDVDLKDLTPAPLGHLLDLAKLFSGGGGETAAAAMPRNIWGVHNIMVNHLPNEMTITGESVQSADDQPKTARVGDPFTVTNEGRYRYDFSVGVPIKNISQTTIDSTNNTVTATTVDKQNIYALVDLYPWKVDVRNQTFSPFPYFVGGVAIASQPLHKILLAAGFGPKFAQFYFGALFVRQDQVAGLTPGDTATPSQVAAAKKHGFEPQFAFGLNLTVRGVNDLLKKK